MYCTVGDYLVMHLSELVRTSFIAATASVDQLKLAGYQALQVLTERGRERERERERVCVCACFSHNMVCLHSLFIHIHSCNSS